MSRTHCRFCDLTFLGLYLNCPKCGTNLMHPEKPKTPAEDYEVAE